MTFHPRRRQLALAGLAAAGFATMTIAQTQEMRMPTRAAGVFDVKLSPQPLTDAAADATLGRMALDKVFHGDLEATGKGEMLMATTAVKGSAGYVAIERVVGALHGRSGSFVLQHTGTMNRGVAQLSVTVVPDSATDQLLGLAGKMHIIIGGGGVHRYEFDYTLPEAAAAPR